MRRRIPILIAAFGLMVAKAPSADAFDPASGDYYKPSVTDIRLVSYNTERNFIAESSRDAAFARVLTVLSPDVIDFQEIPVAISAGQIAARMNLILPNAGGWSVVLGQSDGFTRNVIASRFPLTMTGIDTFPASSTRGVTLALVDLPDEVYLGDIYLMGVHLKCCCTSGCPEDDNRQRSADAIAKWLGDARTPGGVINLPANTPMIVLGDFNLVGGPQPGQTLITGDIQDQATFGPDIKGDWDNSNMTDLMPADPFTGGINTWRSDSATPTSRLDRFIYTDSVVSTSASFVLNTLTMTPAARSAAGLLSNDTTPDSTADHLPIAMDLALASCVPAGPEDDCNDNGVSDTCEQFIDCNSNGVFDACDLSGGSSADCDVNGTPDECQADCDSDGTPDVCELSAGSAVDCNSNGIPDECDIASGVDTDCDASGTLDGCEFETSVIYDIQLADLLNVPANCGNGSRHNNCGSLQPGFAWVDFGLGRVVGVTVQFNAGVNCQTDGTLLQTIFNGAVGPSYTSSARHCSCNFTGGQAVSLDVDPAAYQAGGTNTLLITNALQCLGFVPRAEWGNAYGRVTVTYSNAPDCNANAIYDACDPVIGDADGDGLLTAVDAEALIECMQGPLCDRAVCGSLINLDTCCYLLDIDGDGDVDLGDYAVIERAISSGE